MKLLITILKSIVLFVFLLLYLIFALWCFGALWFGPVSHTVNLITASLFAFLAITAFLFRPRWFFVSCSLLIMCLVASIWSMVKATNEQDWIPEHERLPRFYWENGNPDKDNKFKISNIRDFNFRSSSDFDRNYLDGEFQLSDLTELDYIMVNWDNPMGLWIAHSMLCFRFRDGRSLIVSCETRRAVDVPCGTINGLFHQFNLIYVIGTERDLLALRTHARNPKEDVFCFSTSSTQEQREKIFRDLAKRINGLVHKPRFYNLLIANCTTTLLPSIARGVTIPPEKWQYLFNGFSAKLAYELGFLQKIRPDETYDEMRERCYINPKVKNWDGHGETYSSQYRSGEVRK